MLKKLLTSFASWLIVCSVSFGQPTDLFSTQNIVPPSPEVAALGKYFDIPVGYHTGVPVINIPLYTLKSNALEVPVSLSYNASGIKVEEASTWVGLGWTLNTGGSLTRIVRGIADDWGSDVGYMNTTKTAKYVNGIPPMTQERSDAYHAIANGSIDAEPDIYMFSAGGYSGKFFWSQDSVKFLLAPYQNIKIDYARSGDALTQFILTLPNGVKYYFGVSADGLRSSVQYTNNQDMFSFSQNNGSSQTPYLNTHPHTSSWLLQDVVAPSGKTIKYYYYNTPDETNFGRGGESVWYNFLAGCPFADGDRKSTFYKQVIYKPVLQKISSDLGDVFFVPSTQNREDVFGYGRALDSVVVKNKSGKVVRSFHLAYDYFISPDAPELPGLLSFTQIARKRLRLKAVREMSGGVALPPYEFTYDPVPLPSRLSAAEDFWGYYNGKDNGQFIMPRVRTNVVFLEGGDFDYVAGADRRIDTNFTQAGLLKKITYPTGGTTQYTYEPNWAPQIFYTGINGLERSDLIEKNYHFPLRFEDDPDRLTYVENFTVNDIVGKALMTSVFDGCTNLPAASCRIKVYITGITDPSYQTIINTSDRYHITLPRGVYEMKAIINPEPFGDPVPVFTVDLKWNEQKDSLNFMVGGVRIKKIVSSDGAGKTISRSFTYNKFDNPLYSSAFIGQLPYHVFKTYCGYDELLEYGSSVPSVPRVVSNSAVSLTANGEAVRYLNVTEFYDSLVTSFKTEYTFSSDFAFGFEGQQDHYPLPDHVRKEWQNGVLLNKKQYEKLSSGAYRPLLDESFFYKAYKETNTLFGCKLAFLPANGESLAAGFTTYDFNSEWYLLDSTHTLTYSYPEGLSTSLETSTKNSYNDQFALARTRTINSKGQVLESKTWYPYDYNDVSGFNIPALLQKHIVGVPIKQVSFVNGKIRSGNITKYNEVGLPLESYAYESAALNDAAAHDREVILNSNYALKASIAYVGATPQEVTSQGGFKTSYLWGYQSEYPVAQVVGMDINTVSALSIDPGVLNNPANDQALREVLNNVRTGLAGSKARVTTYTYDPLVGKTSQTDPNGITTYYEYDGLGRLMHIRDNDQNILKKFCYNYQGQQEECQAFGNVAKSGTFTRTSCAAGYWGGQVTYTVPANKYYATTQAAADALAQQDVDWNGPGYANQNGSCNPYYYNTAKSGTYSRNNCTTGGTGSSVTYTVAAGAHSSTISQADADQKAVNDVNQNGQAYANTNGYCTWYSITKGGTFTRNNCSGGVGSSVTYTVAAGAYSSTVSQADANNKAQNDVNQNGQNYANSNGYCTWTSAAASGWFTRNNCGTGSQGSDVLYLVPEGAYTSTISKADADQKAINDVNQNGQNYANQNGTCTVVCTNCSYPKLCSNGVCLRGFKVYTSSVYNPSTGLYECTYHWEYSNGMWSADEIEYSSSPCPVP